MLHNKSFGPVLAAGALIIAAAGPALADASIAPVANGAAQVAITLTSDKGGSCVLDHASAPAGPVTFLVTNKTATSLTEVELELDNRIIGEKENLAPGLPTVSFTLTLGVAPTSSIAPARLRRPRPSP